MEQQQASALAAAMLRQFNGDMNKALNYLTQRGRCFRRAGVHSKARQYTAAANIINGKE